MGTMNGILQNNNVIKLNLKKTIKSNLNFELRLSFGFGFLNT